MSSIDSIREKSIQIIADKKNVFSKFLELERELTEALGDLKVYATSRSIALKHTGPDDWIYGYLSFNNGLKIAYRSTEDDYAEHMMGLSEEDMTYSVKSISLCSVDWLHKLSSENATESLIASIDEKLESMKCMYSDSLNSLDNLLNKESQVIYEDVLNELKDINADNLIKDWIRARNSIKTDSSDSITRSSSYLESVCRKILDDRNVPLPSKTDMSPLIGATLATLNNPKNKTAGNDTEQLMGSIKGLFQGVGTIRTHFGTAHGSSADSFIMDEIYARLVSDAAATASVFLLKLHRNNK